MSQKSKNQFIEGVTNGVAPSQNNKLIVRQSNIKGTSFPKTEAYSNIKDLKARPLTTGKKYFLSPMTFQGSKLIENSAKKAFAVVIQVNLLPTHKSEASEELIARLTVSENKAHKPAMVVFSPNTLEFWWLVVPFFITQEADKELFLSYKFLLAQVVQNALDFAPAITTAVVNQGALADFAFGFRIPTGEEETRKRDDITYFRELSKNHYFKSDIQNLVENSDDLNTFKIKYPARIPYATKLLEFVIALQKLRNEQKNSKQKLKICFARFALEKEISGEDEAIESLKNYIPKSNRKNWHDPTNDIIENARKYKYQYTHVGIKDKLKPTDEEYAQLPVLPLWFSKDKPLSNQIRKQKAIEYREKLCETQNIADELGVNRQTIWRDLKDSTALSKKEARSAQILELHNQGLKQKAIAEKLGICQNTVSLHLKTEREKTLCQT